MKNQDNSTLQYISECLRNIESATGKYTYFTIHEGKCTVYLLVREVSRNHSETLFCFNIDTVHTFKSKYDRYMKKVNT